jgi:putative tryptophan/tyrosine transport system substrate-binding protein
VKRRHFITLLGGAAASPIAARAQQPAVPVIGVLDSGLASDENSEILTALREGLRDAGYVVGRNLAIEYRFAENQYDRLPALAADLVRRRVAVIFASGGGVAVLAAKAATTTIPIVFAHGFDPVQSGLVPRLNRPGGNITGVSFAANLAEAKKLGLLHTVVPHATTIGVLMNPDNASVETQSNDLNEAARVLGLRLPFAFARNEGEFEPAFASFVQQGAAGLVVAADAFFSRRIVQLVELAARHAIPAIYGTVINVRGAAAAGGLMSYGASIPEAMHQAGRYIGRILHGEKPGDLPVMLPTKFELVINLKTAKALRIEVPPTLSAIADEVIE